MLINDLGIQTGQSKTQQISPSTKIHSRWIKDINLRTKIMNLLEENVAETLQDTGIGDEFMLKAATFQAVKAKLNKWNFIKLRNFCIAKKTRE